MQLLIGTTLLWAFSFSLIGVYLAGQVDSWFAVLVRVALAALVLLPITRFRGIPPRLALSLMSIGAVQLGLMYCFYYNSFLYLSVPEVLLFTVMTPIYVTLVNDIFERKFTLSHSFFAFIAVLGAVAIRYDNISSEFLFGMALVQGANLCFATGQVAYKHLMAKQDPSLKQQSLFGWFHLGALCITLLGFLLFGSFDKLPQNTTQWGVLIYLGTIASGLGYLAWNKGATMVNVGALAIANNLLIPAGIIVNVLIWNRDADLLRLGLGGGIILAALLANQWWQARQRSAHVQALA